MALVGRSVSASGSALFLFVEADAEQAVRGTRKSGIGTFPRTRMSREWRFALMTHDGDGQEHFDLAPLDVTFPFIDVFPDGRVLVAGSRSQWRSAHDFDQNGVIVDPANGSKTRFLVGDGVESIAVDSRGRVWASYFDEGIFGNFGWGHPGPEPVGSSGLNCFDDTGKVVWKYPQSSGSGFISDCYAMNVADDTVAIYAYTEFALSRISPDFAIETWKTSLSGCHSFAMSDTGVLFTGQYRDDPSTGYLGSLADGQVDDVTKVVFELPTGDVTGEGSFVGRGETLHYFDDRGWYQIDIGDLAADYGTSQSGTAGEQGR